MFTFLSPLVNLWTIKLGWKVIAVLNNYVLFFQNKTSINLFLLFSIICMINFIIHVTIQITTSALHMGGGSAIVYMCIVGRS